MKVKSLICIIYRVCGKDNGDYKNPEDRTTPLYFQIRNSIKYKNWTNKNFMNNNFTCQECGDNKGGNLQAHHIKFLSIIVKQYNIKTLEESYNCKELWDICNGITLCKNCHNLLHIIYKKYSNKKSN